MEDSSGTKHSEANQIGVLGAGDTAEVPVSARFATAGDKRLTVHVRGRDSRKLTVSDQADVARFLIYDIETTFNWRSVLLTGPSSESRRRP